jgi:hypothetical protein
VSDEGRDYVKRYSPFTGTTFWFHYVMGDLCNKQNDYELFIGDKKLMAEWPFSRRAIVRARAELVEAGFLDLVERSIPGREVRYRFEFPDVPRNGRQIGARSSHAKSESNGRQIGGDRTPKPRSSPLTNRSGTEEELTKTVATFDDDFETLWSEYPRKVDRGKALKAYTARRRSGVPGDDLLAAVRNYAVAKAGSDPAFIKHGSTFFGPDAPYQDFVNGIPDGESVRPPQDSSAEVRVRMVEMQKARLKHLTQAELMEPAPSTTGLALVKP